MSPLERGYRRLLAWYPQDHRARHEDEMIGVLLAGAEPGQSRPSLRDRADLLLGALRMHRRRMFGTGSATLWRDSAAVVTVVCLLLVALQAATNVLIAAVLVGAFWPQAVLVLALSAVALAGIAANSRLIAVPAAVLIAGYLATTQVWALTAAPIKSGGVGFALIVVDLWAALAVLAAGILAFTRNPRRGLTLLGLRRPAIWLGIGLAAEAVSAVGAVGLIDELLLQGSGGRLTPMQELPFVTVCAVAAGLALRSETGRRSVAILAPLLIAHVALTGYFASFEYGQLLAVATVVVPGVVFSVLGWRRLRDRTGHPVESVESTA